MVDLNSRVLHFLVGSQTRVIVREMFHQQNYEITVSILKQTSWIK